MLVGDDRTGQDAGLAPSSAPAAQTSLQVIAAPAQAYPTTIVADAAAASGGSIGCSDTGRFDAVGRTYGIAYSPDGSLFAVGTQASRPNARIYRTSDRSLVQTLEGHAFSTFSVAFSPDGSLLATAGERRDDPSDTSPTVKLWRVSDGTLLQAVPANTGFYVSSVEFSHDGRLLATSGYRGYVEIWRVSDGARLLAIPVAGTVYRAHFSPDDAMISTASTDRSARIFRVADGTPLYVLLGHSYSATDATFSPSGNEIVVSGYDNTAILYDLVGKTAVQTLVQNPLDDPPTGKDYVERALWPEPNLIVTNDWGGNVRMWTRGSNGRFTASCLRQAQGQSIGLAVSPKGLELRAGGSSSDGSGVWTWSLVWIWQL